tara:strand:- start:774 stop:4817 length:4044 start_codon:yes stop_codon:yes gene_type:complete
MAFDPYDPKYNPTLRSSYRKKKEDEDEDENEKDINKNLYTGIDETDIQLPDAELNNEVSGATAFTAGLASGVIKVGEGVVSLGAELIDLGVDTDTAASVEQFFDDLNPFEEIAEQRAIGKLTEAFVQVAVPGGAGAKAATMAAKALKAKRAGKYLNFKAKNLKQGLDKTKQLNKLSGKQRFAAIVAGGAAGETLVADVEKIGTFGDLFEGGPTELNREVTEDPSEDAARKLANRLKFGSESILLTPFVYGVGAGAKALAKRGKELAYSSSKIERGLDKLGSVFRFRGTKPQEIAFAKQTQKARQMRDTNFSEEMVARIDKEVDKIFPEFRKVLNASSVEERKAFLKILDDILFEGDLNAPLDSNLSNMIEKTVINRLGKKEGVIVTDNLLKVLNKTRNEFNNLLEITASGPGAKVDLPVGITRDLRQIMGNRVKNYIGNTFEIFENAEAGFFSKYKPTQDSIDNAKALFMRYAAKNENPITELEAEGMVNDIIKQVRKMDPRKDTLPTFAYQNLSKAADDATGLKTFAQTLTKDLPGGKKDLQVIGKGSKVFRELFGEIEDARHSIFEGMNRLSTIARKNQLFDEILDVDDAMKAAAKSDTPLGQRGFFHASPLIAKRAFGPNADIVPMDDYVKEYFKDGVLINRLAGTYTTREIAEGFTNVSNIQNWMRGEAEGQGALGKTFSWAWRNLLLTPKAGAQYAKTILSIPTHIRNFLSSAAFSLANGSVGPGFGKAMNRAFGSVQVGGPRKPISQEKYREYLELGITNTNVRLGDLRNLMKDVRFGEGNIATDSILKPMINTLGKKTSRLIKKGAKIMQDLYVAEDDIWKIVGYETQLLQRGNAYKKAGIKVSDDALKKEVAQIVQDTIPNYAKVGEFVRAARMSPFGNFMSWPSEIFRTGTGIFRQIIKDMKDPLTGKINPITSKNPMKGLAMKRLIGTTLAMGAIPYGLIKGSQAMFGVSNEEADAANDFVAPWAKDSQKIYMRDPETDELYYINWSQNNVYDTLTRPFQTVLRSIQEGVEDEEILLKGFVQGIAEAAGQTASPFISESIYTEAFMDIWGREGRTREGKQLYNDQTPEPEKIGIIMTHLGKTLLPTTQPFQRTIKGFTGEPGKGGEIYEIPYELAGIFGFRPIKVDPEKSLGFKMFEYQKGISDSRGLFTSEIDPTEMKTPEDVIKRYFVANKQTFDVKKKMLQTINNAKSLGMKDDKIFELFDKRGLGSVYNELTSAQFKPFYPSKKVIERFDDLADKIDIKSVFDQAESTINQMEDKMYKLNLYQDWNINLEDFLPDTDPQGQSALPPTPMPDPQVVQTAAMPAAGAMNQGLTPTENALLSEEEKQIRLRQRGLA